MASITLPSEWRKAQGFTLADAASMAGVEGKNPGRSWQRWERGEQKPPVRVMLQIEKLSSGVVSLASWAKAREVFLEAAKTEAA